jgi:hypothetical protein
MDCFTTSERNRVESLANRVGTEIPESLNIFMICIPIIEKLLDRIEKLENKKGGDDHVG